MKKTLAIIFILHINNFLFCREYSLSFLKLPTTARQTALNGYIALSDDIGGIFCNPSGLVNSTSQIGFSHNEHFQQIKYDFLGYIVKKRNYTVAFGLAALYADNIEGRTGERDFDPIYVNIYQITHPEFYYDVYDIQAGVSFARTINSRMSFGMTIKFVSEKIYNIKGNTILLDGGFQYNLDKNFIFGLAINNFGMPVKYLEKYYPAATQLGAGGRYKFKKFCLVLDVVKPLYDDLFLNVGSEIEIIDYFVFRLGYKYKPYGWYLKSDLIVGGSLGFGVNYLGTKIDYSISSFGELGMSHKISLIIEVEEISKFYKLLRKKLFGK